jgi:hypothetical protein
LTERLASKARQLNKPKIQPVLFGLAILLPLASSASAAQIERQ